ncbi:MAG TPA: tetratricopeptide repeat protein [Oculatellaceae cyanobacterium]
MIQVQQTLREALHKHQQGDLAGASSLYLRVLEYDPNNVDALGLMSMIADKTGDHDTAIALANKAIELKPRRVELYINLANPLLASKRVDEAIETLEKAMQIDRRSVDVLSTLGDAYQEKGDFTTAIELYHKGLRLDRSDPILYNNLGNAFKKLFSYEKAIEAFEKALSLNPHYADAHYNLATTYHTLERKNEAMESLRRALACNPAHYQASMLLGALYAAENKLDEAMAAYQDVLKNNPDPRENFNVLVEMGNISLMRMKLDAAEDCFRTALKLKKDNAEVLSKLAFVLSSQNKVEEAEAIYDQLIAESPNRLDYHLAKALCIPILYPSVEAINTCRATLEQRLQALRGQKFEFLGASKTAFYLSYHGKNDRAIMEALAELTMPYLSQGETVSPCWNVKPRIGFISAFMHEGHTIGKLNRGIIRNFSRDLFDVFVFSVGKLHQYNEVGDEHPMDEYILISEKDLEQAKRSIIEKNLDILFYLDIGMDTMTLSLAHGRLARIQCVTWGHPDTTGLKTIDYFVSSKLIEPENAQEHYTEELFLLDNLPTYYYAPPKFECHTVRSILGIADTETIYLCPQSIFKLHPEFDPILGEILRRDPNGRLVLLSATAEKANQDLMERFRTSIPDVAARILLPPRLLRQDFLALLFSAGVMLDPIHFGGGNTTFEALSYGTPIITMPGEFMRGRVTYGCYQKMGYTELVAKTPEEYINLAVRLGTDPAERQRVQQEILSRCGVLYEDASAVRELEAFFLSAIEKAKAKQGERDA